MQITMYGIRSCHDCVDAENLLKEKKIPFTYLDFAENPVWLKEFLQLRDRSPLFEEVRKNGWIGIPYFELEDGTKTFDVKEVAEKA